MIHYLIIMLNRSSSKFILSIKTAVIIISSINCLLTSKFTSFLYYISIVLNKEIDKATEW